MPRRAPAALLHQIKLFKEDRGCIAHVRRWDVLRTRLRSQPWRLVGAILL